MIWADSGDPRADSPLQNLCNSLGFSWSGQVSCVPWCAGMDFCKFSAIYWKHWNLHKIMGFLKISEKFRFFSKFSVFCIFQAIDPPKPWINDKEYWCFCKPVDFAEIMIFIKKAKICEKITFFIFVIILWKSDFLRKWAPGRQEPLKGMELHWFYKAWRIRAARDQKARKVAQTAQIILRIRWKSWFSYKKLEISGKSPFCALPKRWYSL